LSTVPSRLLLYPSVTSLPLPLRSPLSHSRATPRPLPSFPTRRSSDLISDSCRLPVRARGRARRLRCPGARLRRARAQQGPASRADRKSTRLNSSHVKISYAVFCLKKKMSTCGGSPLQEVAARVTDAVD